MTDTTTDNSEPAQPLGLASTEGLGPVAEVKCGRLQWAIPRDDYRLPLRFLNNDTHPLYDQAALDAAVAAERERCAKERQALRAAILDIADAARLSPYREANQWDDALAKLIARKVEFLRPSDRVDAGHPQQEQR